MKRKVALPIATFAGVAIAVPLVERRSTSPWPSCRACTGRCRPAWSRRSWRALLGRGSPPCSRPDGRAASELGFLNFSTTVVGSGVSTRARCWRRRPSPCWCSPGAAARSKENLTCLDVERLAVLELDASLQLEGVGLGIGRDGPALGQQRRDRAVHVDLRQPLEDVVVHDLADRRRRRDRRVEAGGSSTMPITTEFLRRRTPLPASRRRARPGPRGEGSARVPPLPVGRAAGGPDHSGGVPCANPDCASLAHGYGPHRTCT